MEYFPAHQFIGRYKMMIESDWMTGPSFTHALNSSTWIWKPTSVYFHVGTSNHTLPFSWLTSSSSRALPRVAAWGCGEAGTFWMPCEAFEITLRAFWISSQTVSLLALREATSECSKQAEQIECKRGEFSFNEARAPAISSLWFGDFKSWEWE